MGSKFVGWVKEHPVLSGVFFVLTLILLYIVTRGSSSNGSTSTGKTGGLSETGQLQLAQINAGLATVQTQTAAALDATRLKTNADITNQANQIAAQLTLGQLDAANKAKAIDAATYTTMAALTEKQNEAVLSTDVAKLGITTQAAVSQSEIDAALQEVISHDALTAHVVDTTAATQQLAIQTQGMIAENQNEVELASIDYNRNIADKVLNNPEFGHRYGGSSTGVAQIVSSLQGQGPAALASTNPGAYGSPLDSILKFGSDVVKGLLL